MMLEEKVATTGRVGLPRTSALVARRYLLGCVWMIIGRVGSREDPLLG